jgi:hypothetical protein
LSTEDVSLPLANAKSRLNIQSKDPHVGKEPHENATDAKR